MEPLEIKDNELARTPNRMRKLQIEKYRKMSGEERLLIGLRLHQLACDISREAIRAQNPEATPEEVEEKLRQRLRLAYTLDLNSERHP